MARRYQSGKITKLCGVVLILNIWFCFCIYAEAPSTKEKTNILCLMSFHPGSSWETEAGYAFREEFLKQFPDANLYFEFLDGKRFPGDAQHERFALMLTGKYPGDFLDLVVCINDEAFDFMLKERKRLFPDVPLVFCGVNNYNPEFTSRYKNITGITERVSVGDTVEVALKLFPRTREAVFVYDNTSSGVGNRRVFDASLPGILRRHPQLEIRFLSGRDISTDELFETLSKLPDDSICLFSNWYRDKNGYWVSERELAERLSRLKNVPVFGLTGIYPGIIGGRFSSALAQGREAAKLAAQIIRGVNVESLPVHDLDANGYVFDRKQLSRWKLSSRHLPEGSTIINQSFFDQHYNMVMSIAALILLQAMIIVTLIFSVMRRLRAEREISNLSNDLKIIFDSIGDAVISVTADGWIERVNPIGLKLCGMSEEEITGKYVSEVFRLTDPESGQPVEMPLRKALESGKAVETGTAATIKALDGGEHQVLVSVSPVIDHDGKIIALIIVMKDVTHEHLHRESLLASEERFRTLFEHAPMLIAQLTPSGQPLYFNQAWCDLFDMSHDALVRIPSEKIFSLEGMMKSRKACARLADKSESRVSLELPLKLPDGRDVEIIETLVPMYDGAGGVKYIISIAQNTSAEASTRKELEWEREQRELILQSITETIMHLDRNMRIVWINRNPLDITANAGELKGTYYYDVLFGSDAMVEDCPVRKTFSSGEAQRREISTDDGRVLLISTTPVLDTYHHTNGVVVTSMDMTELRNLERQFLHAQKMDAVGKLAGGVAHDFNNIIQVILGYSDLIKSKLSDEKALGMWQNIIDAGKSARQLVRQLLTFSRSDDGDNRGTEDLNLILRNFKKMISRVLGEDIDFQLKLCDSTLNVLVDIGQIEQVLMNLCVNARDAMPNGGKLVISSRETDYAPFVSPGNAFGVKGRFACCEIVDTGCGIPVELQSRIFEPFFSTKKVGGGTGLGLATTYAIIEKHGGVISVNSAIDRGTVFRFFLPIVSETIKLSDAFRSADDISIYSTSGNETVLLVEDDDMVREIGKILLESVGYNVIEAEDGNAGINAFDANADTIKVALLDVLLPGVSGKAVADHIASVNPALPILFCSGYTGDIIDVSTIEHKLIRKPYNPNELLRRIQMELERTRTPSN
ncbi:MAG: PAS domain-containing protein [Victivallales bacterium]|nr:PAS domain-containing protein [Victivallales bacterium]